MDSADALSCDSMSTSGEFEIVAEGKSWADLICKKEMLIRKVLAAPSAKPTGNADPKAGQGLQPRPSSSQATPCAADGGDGSLTLLATSPPTLNIANNGDWTDLEQNLKEMIREIEKSPIDSDSVSSLGKGVGSSQNGKVNIVGFFASRLKWLCR